MPTSTATSAYNIAALNSQQQALQSGLLQENGNGEGGSSGVDDGTSGQLLATGNASNPYAATSGQGNYVVSVPGAGPDWTQSISAGKNGTTQITSPTYSPDESWGKFLTVAGIGGAFAGAALGAAGEFASADAAVSGGSGAAAAAPTTTASSGALSADDSLAQIGNWGGDSVYGTSAPGGLADASGAGIPGSTTGTSLLGQAQNLYQQVSPYKTALQGAQQVAGLDNGQASTTSGGSSLLSAPAAGAAGTSTLGGLGGILSTIGGLTAASQQPANTQSAINIADPNQANQAGYLAQLQSLVNNPGSVANSPEFTAANSAALAGVAANSAAGGFNGSGKTAAALYQTGLADQQNFYQQDVSNLEQLGGINQANQTAAGGYQEALPGQIAADTAAAGGGISSAINGLFGNNGIGTSLLSSAGKGISSAYSSLFGGGTGEGSDVAGSAWSTGGAGGEGVTGSLAGWNGAQDSALADTASSASSDAGDFSSAFEDFF